MNKYKRDFKALAEYSSGRVHHLIRMGDDDFILAILDAVWTMLERRVKLLPKHRRTIQSVLHQFASRGQSVEERRCHLLTRTVIQAVQTLFKQFYRNSSNG